MPQFKVWKTLFGFLLIKYLWYGNCRERILRLEHENKKLKEQKLGEQEDQVGKADLLTCFEENPNLMA